MLKFLSKITKYGDVSLAFVVIGILMVLLFPVPTSLLDFLLAFSISIAFVILMTTLFIQRPLELSVFPTILLVTTLLRLSLNIASTRLILSRGHFGPDAAGQVIEAFGHFIMQGNVVIGLIVFLILTLINFIVITKGSGRIAEVAARFSLDAMPGKQMAIDSDLSSGLIDSNTAKERRKTLESESTFYGAMDGANKFVRGDAIAGLIITFINLVGGIIIGVAQRGLKFDVAIKTYSILTIGDGLVSQIPSLIVSLSAGLLVTKSGITGSAEKAIFGQLSKYPRSLWMTALVTGMMVFAPGLPPAPFIILALIISGIGYLVYQKGVDKSGAVITKDEDDDETEGAKVLREDAQSKDDDQNQALHLDLINLDLSYSLLPLVKGEKGSTLTDQINSLRMQTAKEFGFIIPAIHIKDDLQLENNQYVIKIKEIKVGDGTIIPDQLLVMNPSGDSIDLPGQVVKEPAFGLDAKWITENYRQEALFKDYTIVNPSNVIMTHLTELVKENITDMLSYGAVQALLDNLPDIYSKLVKDTIPDIVSIATLQKILQNLLAEKISIKDLPKILEASADAAKQNQGIIGATEFVRTKLARQISHMHTNSEGMIPVITLSNTWDQVFTKSLVGNGDDKKCTLAPSKLQELVQDIEKKYEQYANLETEPVLIVSDQIRPYIRMILERFRPSVMIMSHSEIYRNAQIKQIDEI
ncbi:MAG: flagellar biosynthesis protein FlhA [Rickettsiaceae bacterium]